MILVGDVGGTKTLLEIGVLCDGTWQPAHGARYAAADHPDLQSVLRDFLEACRARALLSERIAGACFGVAGPVAGNRAQLTNLPWQVDGAAIAAAFGIPQVQVVNDFAAAASGVALLQPADLFVLQAGEPLPGAPRLVLGAGTGLGVAHVIPSGADYLVIPGEGGHAGFAPASVAQDELWRELFALQGRVIVEDVVSGPGLARMHAHLLRREGQPPAAITPAAIVHGALVEGDTLCLRVLDLFIECYGGAARNLALAVLPRGGVYIAGGIAPRILARLAQGDFMAAFTAPGAHVEALRKMPVSVVTNDRLGLLGAAWLASRPLAASV
jgi:glucokinase